MRGIKVKIEEVQKYVNEHSECKLISKLIKNVDEKLEFICYCGDTFYKSYQEFKQLDNKCCSKCNRKNRFKYTYEFIKNYIENESNSGCKLLSENVAGEETLLEVKCSCGNIYRTYFKSFYRNKKHMCNNCSRKIKNELQKYDYSEVKEYLKERNCILLSKEYPGCRENLKLQCQCGNIFYRNFDYMKSRKIFKCSDCVSKDKKIKNIIKIKNKISKILNQKKLKFIKEIDIIENRNSRFIVECENNHQFQTYLGCLESVKHGCRICFFENNRGKNNPSWKGGRTPLYDFLRRNLDQWKQDSMKFCNYKCVMTGKEFDVIHHLYGFNLILDETLNKLSLPIYNDMTYYSEHEINLIINACVELHYKYGFGVCLSKDIHVLFHKLYGKQNNTHYQFEEFCQRYYSGEFIDLINDNNLTSITTN